MQIELFPSITIIIVESVRIALPGTTCLFIMASGMEHIYSV